MRKIFTIIPASGLGQRFGSTIPKQLCHIDDEVILEKTHRIFDIEVIYKIYIAVNRVILDLLLPLKKISAPSLSLFYAAGTVDQIQ